MNLNTKEILLTILPCEFHTNILNISISHTVQGSTINPSVEIDYCNYRGISSLATCAVTISIIRQNNQNLCRD